MSAVTVATVLIVAVLAAMLVLSGPVAEAVGNAVGLGGAFLAVWNIAKWPVIALLVVAGHRHPVLRHPQREAAQVPVDEHGLLDRPRGVRAGVAGLRVLRCQFGSYNKTYGAIGGVIVMLLWLWILNLSLLFGAEFDAETERGRQLQAGIEAEETIQLPPRDTKQSDKLQSREEEDIRRGRELREQQGGRSGTPAPDSRPLAGPKPLAPPGSRCALLGR